MAPLFPDDARRRADSNYCRARGRNASERRALRAGAGTAIRSGLQPRHRNIFGTSDFACVGHRCSHPHAGRAGRDRRLALSGLQRPSLPTSKEKNRVPESSGRFDCAGAAQVSDSGWLHSRRIARNAVRACSAREARPTQSRERRSIPADCVRIGFGRRFYPMRVPDDSDHGYFLPQSPGRGHASCDLRPRDCVPVLRDRPRDYRSDGSVRSSAIWEQVRG